MYVGTYGKPAIFTKDLVKIRIGIICVGRWEANNFYLGLGKNTNWHAYDICVGRKANNFAECLVKNTN